jgi:hypothetical protein
MPRPEFGRVKLSDIPEEIIDEYKLREIAMPDKWFISGQIKPIMV